MSLIPLRFFIGFGMLTMISLFSQAQDSSKVWVGANVGFDWGGAIRSQNIANDFSYNTIYSEPDLYVAPPVVFNAFFERQTKSNKRIGVGVSYKYGNSGARLFVDYNIGPHYDPSNPYPNLEPSVFNVEEQKLTIWFYQNLKMPLKAEKIQVYFPLMVGVTMISEKILNGQYSESYKNDKHRFKVFPNFRIAIGWQYLLAERFALRFEPIGIGGPFMSGGVSYRFR